MGNGAAGQRLPRRESDWKDFRRETGSAYVILEAAFNIQQTGCIQGLLVIGGIPLKMGTVEILDKHLTQWGDQKGQKPFVVYYRILSDSAFLASTMVEGSLEVKLPTDEKQSRAEAERREKVRREKSRRERVRRKKMQMREKVGKSRFTVFFQWFASPEGRKVGSLKRRVRSQLARWKMTNCTQLWREADFQVKM